MEPQYLLFQFSYIHEVIIHADDYLFLKDSVTGSKTGLVNTNRVDNDTISAFIYTISQETLLNVLSTITKLCLRETQTSKETNQGIRKFKFQLC